LIKEESFAYSPFVRNASRGLMFP